MMLTSVASALAYLTIAIDFAPTPDEPFPTAGMCTQQALLSTVPSGERCRWEWLPVSWQALYGVSTSLKWTLGSERVVRGNEQSRCEMMGLSSERLMSGLRRLRGRRG